VNNLIFAFLTIAKFLLNVGKEIEYAYEYAIDNNNIINLINILIVFINIKKTISIFIIYNL
jgi:hypothetical protein